MKVKINKNKTNYNTKNGIMKVGILMDKITELTGSTNYIAPFVICDILLVGTIICTCFIGKVRSFLIYNSLCQIVVQDRTSDVLNVLFNITGNFAS